MRGYLSETCSFFPLRLVEAISSSSFSVMDSSMPLEAPLSSLFFFSPRLAARAAPAAFCCAFDFAGMAPFSFRCMALTAMHGTSSLPHRASLPEPARLDYVPPFERALRFWSAETMTEARGHMAGRERRRFRPDFLRSIRCRSPVSC
ncbi:HYPOTHETICAL PROTEIN SM_b21485 (plasmid) [Sinorhizobium meliloti 1021]|uniref:Uncharacterized protein n=1 Tax=Rhizobium meliloti (strain 1021) TaxID=266834 RepID=Q92U29_RHIME|nr:HYPOTHETICAL PROTEIN SM_b21485 [Sinorhizobium meliloti 1021]